MEPRPYIRYALINQHDLFTSVRWCLWANCAVQSLRPRRIGLLGLRRLERGSLCSWTPFDLRNKTRLCTRGNRSRLATVINLFNFISRVTWTMPCSPNRVLSTPTPCHAAAGSSHADWLHFAWGTAEAKCTFATAVCASGLSVPGRLPTLLHGPGTYNLAEW